MFPVHVLVACKIIGHKAKVWIIVAGSGSRVKVIGNRARAIWGKKNRREMEMVGGERVSWHFDEVTERRRSLMGHHYPMILEKLDITFPFLRSR